MDNSVSRERVSFESDRPRSADVSITLGRAGNTMLAMVTRVGTDVIEIERIERALERPGFRDRCFTAEEQAYCESRGRPAESYAARFCGKEAVGKALGCGVLFTWKDIEIVGPPKPGVTLTGKTLRFAERVGMREIDVSLTHSRTVAAATCVAELETPLPRRPRA